MYVRSKRASLRGLPALTAILCAGGVVSPAWAGTVGGVEASVSTRAMTNPFNAASANGVTLAVSPSISPWLNYEDPDTVIDVRGVALVDQYTRGYGRNTTGSANANLQQRMSDRVSLRGGVNYVNSTAGVHDTLLDRTAPADQVAPPGSAPIDITSPGIRSHFQNLNGRIGADFKLGTRDSVSLDLGSTLARSSAAGSSDFVNGMAILGYSRTLSQRTSVQLSMQYVKVDYFKTDQGDSSVFSPSAGFTQQLTRRLQAQISLGATVVRLKKLPGQVSGFTILAGSFRLCDTIKGGAICLSGSRSAQPTTLGGLSASQEVSLAIDKRISEADVLNVTGRYASVSQKDGRGFSQDIIGLLANVSHKFDQRFNGFVTPSYSRTFGGLAPRAENYELRVGVVYRFGALR